MIFISRKNSIGSKSVAEELYNIIKPHIDKHAYEFSEDFLEDIKSDMYLYRCMWFDELNIPQFNLVYRLIDKHWVEGHWCKTMKPLLLELMQADPRFEHHKKVA